jgi:Tfp pilus assembly protein PilF
MKRNFLIWIACVVLMMLVTSCKTTDNDAKKQEAKATRRLGEAYLHQGNYAAALKEFRKAEKKYPDDHILQYDLGQKNMMRPSPTIKRRWS